MALRSERFRQFGATTADQEDPLEAPEAVDFTSLLADALLDGPATMIGVNVKEFETYRPTDYVRLSGLTESAWTAVRSTRMTPLRT